MRQLTANDFQNEIWKDIEGFEGQYQISNLGRVKSLGRYVDNVFCGTVWVPERIRKLSSGKTSVYLMIQLKKGEKTYHCLVHRLVAQHFFNDWDKTLEVNHIDGDKLNNCVWNLEMCTRQKNIDHSIAHGLKRDYGEQSSNSKLTNKQVKSVRDMYSRGVKQVDMAKMYNVCKQTINNIVHDKTYFK